jgi:hypothetical protein
MSQYVPPEYRNPYGETPPGSPGPEEGGGSAGPPTEAELQAWYQEYLGRSASAEEIHAQRSTGAAGEEVRRSIQNSPEAAKYRKSKETPTPPPPAPGAPLPTPSGGWESWFLSLTNGKPVTAASLVALEPELKKYGVSLSPSASGKQGKIKLPDGTIVDVMRGSGLVNGEPSWDAWQWMTGDGGGGSDPATPFDPAEFGKLRQPYGESFSYDPYGGTTPFSWDVPSPDAFKAPTPEDLYNDPGYQVRMQEGQHALESSAAAKGSLMTGGTLRSLARYGQEQGSKEYGDAFNRSATTWGLNTGQYNTDRSAALTAYQTNAQNKFQDWTTNYTKALNEYQMRYGIWNTQQMRDFENLYKLSQLGVSAA